MLGEKKLWTGKRTKYNRHPILFSRCQEVIPNPSHVLSFGCSFGVEVRSLRELYFDDNTIIDGLDVYESRIEKAKEDNKDLNNVNFYSYKDFPQVKEKYDIIFALNCICNYKRGKEKFVKFINGILESIKINGIFCVHNYSYDIGEMKEFENKIIPVKLYKEEYDDTYRDFFILNVGKETHYL